MNPVSYTPAYHSVSSGNKTTFGKLDPAKMPKWMQSKQLQEATAQQPQGEPAVVLGDQPVEIVEKPVVALTNIAIKNQKLEQEIKALQASINNTKEKAPQLRQDYKAILKNDRLYNQLQHKSLKLKESEEKQKNQVLEQERKHRDNDVLKQYRLEQQKQRKLLRQKSILAKRVDEEKKRSQRQMEMVLVRGGLLPRNHFKVKKAKAQILKAQQKGKPPPKRALKVLGIDPDSNSKNNRFYAQGNNNRAKGEHELELVGLDKTLHDERLAFEHRHMDKKPIKQKKRSLWNRLIYNHQGKIKDRWKLNLFHLTLPVAGAFMLLSPRGSGASKTAGFFGAISLIGSLLGLCFNLAREVGAADWFTQGLTGNLDKYENKDAGKEDFLHSTYHNEFGMSSGD